MWTVSAAASLWLCGIGFFSLMHSLSTSMAVLKCCIALRKSPALVCIFDTCCTMYTYMLRLPSTFAFSIMPTWYLSALRQSECLSHSVDSRFISA